MHFITEILNKILEKKITVYDRKINNDSGEAEEPKQLPVQQQTRYIKKFLQSDKDHLQKYLQLALCLM